MKSNKKKKSNLSSLEWFVYTLLQEETLGKNKALSQREIYDACKEVGFDVYWSDTQNQHNDHCRWLKNVTDHINKSMEVDMIIHHHAYRYYLCTFEQAQELVDFYDKKIVFAAARKRSIVKKIKRHNQGKLLSNQGNVIDEQSKAKRFYETFAEKRNKIQGEQQ